MTRRARQKRLRRCRGRRRGRRSQPNPATATVAGAQHRARPSPTGSRRRGRCAASRASTPGQLAEHAGRHDDQPPVETERGQQRLVETRERTGARRRDGPAQRSCRRGWASTSRSACTRRTCSSTATASPRATSRSPSASTTTACSASSDRENETMPSRPPTPPGPLDRDDVAHEPPPARLQPRADDPRLQLAALLRERAVGAVVLDRAQRSTVWRSSASSSAASGSSGGRTAGSRRETARARSAAASTRSAPPGRARRQVELGQAAPVHGGRGREVDAAEAGLVGSQVGERAPGPPSLAARGARSPGRDVRARSSSCSRAVIGSRRVGAGRVARACCGRRLGLACGQVGLGRDERCGLRRQPGALALELVAQPQRRPGQARGRTSGREVALQQHQFGRRGATGRCRGAGSGRGRGMAKRRPLRPHRRSARSGPARVRSRRGPGRAGRAGRSPRRAPARRRPRCTSPASPRTRARSSSQTPSRDLDVSRRPVHGTERAGQPAGEELGVAEVVQRLNASLGAGRRRGDSMARTNRRRADPSSPRSMRRLPPLIRIPNRSRGSACSSSARRRLARVRVAEHRRCGRR